MKALFVHGLCSDKNSKTGGFVKEILKSRDFEVLTDTFDLLKPEETLGKIRTYAAQVDMLIGTSLGAFYVLATGTNATPIRKIVLNPCMFPSIEVPKLQGIPEETLLAWQQLEKNVYETVDENKKLSTFGAFADDDELFSYRDFFVQKYGRAVKGENGIKNYAFGPGKHRLTYEEIVPFLSEGMRYLLEV